MSQDGDDRRDTIEAAYLERDSAIEMAVMATLESQNATTALGKVEESLAICENERQALQQQLRESMIALKDEKGKQTQDINQLLEFTAQHLLGCEITPELRQRLLEIKQESLKLVPSESDAQLLAAYEEMTKMNRTILDLRASMNSLKVEVKSSKSSSDIGNFIHLFKAASADFEQMLAKNDEMWDEKLKDLVEEHENKTHEWEDTLISLHSNYQNIKGPKMVKLNEYTTLEKEKEAINQIRQSLERENRQLKQQKDNEFKDLEKLEEINESLKKETVALKLRLKNDTAELKALQDERDEIQEKYQRLQKENAEMKLKLRRDANVSEELKILQDEKDEIEEQYQFLRTENAEIKLKLRREATASGEFKALQDERDEIEEKYQVVRTENAEMKLKLRRTQQKFVATASEELKTLQEERDEIEEKYQTVKKENVELKVLEIERDEIRTENERIKSQLKKLEETRETSTSQERYEAAEAEIQRVMVEYNETAQELSTLKERREVELDEVKKQNQKLELDLNEIKTQEKVTGQKIKHLEAENKKLKERVATGNKGGMDPSDVLALKSQLQMHVRHWKRTRPIQQLKNA